MFIFVEPGQRYIRDGFQWQVMAIDQNLVHSSCIGHDINDLEQLKEFNRQVVSGEISVIGQPDSKQYTTTGAQ